MPAISDKMKKAKLDAIMESLRQGATLESACAAANLDASTLRKWRQADEELQGAVCEAQEAAIMVAESALFKKAAAGSMGHLAFFLCNRAPGRWQHVNNVRISGGLEHKHTLRDFVAQFGNGHAGEGKSINEMRARIGIGGTPGASMRS